MTASPKKQIINHINQLDFNGYYTYAEYLTWQLNEMVELIKGKLFKMSPASNTPHQQVSLHLTRILDRHFEANACQLFVAPFDVRFPSEDGNTTDTVVQPDLCVICDLKKLDIQGCNGTPDLVVEILSPGNTQKEMNEKFLLYESSGVKEYWLAHPEDEWLVIYHLNNEKKYTGSKHFTPQDGIIQSVLFSDLFIDLTKVFDLLELG